MKKVTDILGNWVNENYMQEISLALRGLGKFRLVVDVVQKVKNVDIPPQILGDGAFPLRTWIMKPHAWRRSFVKRKKIF